MQSRKKSNILELWIILLCLIAFIPTNYAFSQEKNVEETVSIDKKIDELFKPIASWSVKIVYWSFPVETLELKAKEVGTSGNKLAVKVTRNLKNKELFDITVRNTDTLETEVLKNIKISTLKDTLDEKSKWIELVGENPSNRPMGQWKGGINRFQSLSGGSKNGAASIHVNCQISIPLVLAWLMIGAVFFTLFFKFINIRLFKVAINTVRGKYSNMDDRGEVSHFQALTAALSGTVGLGNIAGVAIAIQVGGAGATFWMIIAGLLGMSTKFVECTLGVKYRKVDPDGRVMGGPMLYLADGLKEKNLAGLGKALAILFSIMCIGGAMGGGNMFQVNAAYTQFTEQTGLLANNGWVFGLIIAIIVGLVIIGGIRSIARATSKIVPFMCGIYAIAALIIIGMHITEVPAAIGTIIREAFAPMAVGGGMLGVLFQGIKRAAFSNEAGVGSASIAHSAVKTNYPASEGIVSLLEPFIDTVIVCTLTALVIILTGQHLNPDDLAGVTLTSAAFESVIPHFSYVLMIAVILFAISTMITWSYYGQQCWGYLFGRSKVKDIMFKLIFCFFIIVGASSQMGSVLDFSDMMILGMSFPNLIGLYFLVPVVKKELTKYLNHVKNCTPEPD
jgi:AGCS family alanine or glycine:cation symporter